MCVLLHAGVHYILDGTVLMFVYMQGISQLRTVSCNIFYVLTKSEF